MIRDSTTRPGFALSLKNINRVQRYFIAYSEETKAFTFADQAFESIDALINFHSTSPVLTCKLLQPAPKGYYCVLYDYKGKESLDLCVSCGDKVAFLIQKKQWIFCSTPDGRKGWVPEAYLQPFNEELYNRLQSEKNEGVVPFCSRIFPVPTDAVAIKSRNPSLFATDQLKIEKGVEVIVQKILRNGFCEVTRKDTKAQGFLPISYLKLAVS
ncbi:unnamed protein product [Dibothriocephalus latus]|uniref:SH3 domain-containing protein n=1 Tax=Dibothriocephalus latus TaxID=60516 RepID=A0A3P7LL74_DIBLA|nr:unnamed protein product [Dibothriocephalus latus]